MTCGTCGGTGILIGALYLNDELDSFDADQIARCDTCERYEGDLEAATALAQQQRYGAWLVWAGDLRGGLPATEQPNIFVRSTPGDAACLQLAILNEQQEEAEVPAVLAHVTFIEQGAPDNTLRAKLLPRVGVV